MAESSNPEAGKRFASDLRQIREHRGISVEALHDETKIPMGLIQSFEQTGLFDHPMFNRVYLRSFVRTYSQVVGVSQDLALASLDEALEGTYQGGLAEAYLKPAEPVAEEVEEPAPAAEVTAPEETFGLEESVSEEESTPEAEMTPEEEVASEEEMTPEAESASQEELVSEEETAPEVVSGEAATVYHESASEQEVTPYEEQERFVAEEVSQTPQPMPEEAFVEEETQEERAADRPAVAPRSEPVRREPEAERTNKGWLYAAAGVVAVVALGFLLFRGMGTPGDNLAGAVTNGEAETAATPDTSSVAATPPPVALGDTMRVTIVAANAPVQNIKVTVDDDLRRPYWIEFQESKTFTPAQRIVIERQLPKIQLQVEGRPYPTNRTDELGRIVITRDSVLQFLNSTR